jgi:predicted RNase H-like HicB family nuclease
MFADIAATGGRMAMGETSFDRTRVDALVAEIGAMILADRNYADREWTGIALVIELAERRRMYGFIYLADGDWEAETPDDFDILETAASLREVMAEGSERWARCLVSLARPGPRLTVAFDHDGTADWTVSTANYSVMAEKLRP